MSRDSFVDFVLRPEGDVFPVRVKDLFHYAAILLRGRATQRESRASSEVLVLYRKGAVSGTLD